ncbi:YqeB family protein [Microbacterium karelineae]|uniref:YqeB family protein n=1 Tax=Microbacterium karelineae TaxID=2654283 RepID=UPI0012E9B66E|nr:hypothetical protein [Microbacterium karelineae]
MHDEAVTVTVPARWRGGLVAILTVVGFGSAFAVGPLVDWLIGRIDSAPGVLRLAAELPLWAAIPILTVVGAVAGFLLAEAWREDSARVRVDRETTTVTHRKTSVRLARDEVAAIYTDRGELVLTGENTEELLRVKADETMHSRLREAFTGRDWPWLGAADPHDADFAPWVDHSDDLSAREHDLMRARHRALSDGRAGAAADAGDALRELGIVVRDRSQGQQYRRR